MWLEITGTKSKRIRKLVEDAARFFEKELIHPRTATPLNARWINFLYDSCKSYIFVFKINSSF